jgi:RNA polymerase sigma-70 factor (ECF subfamily)
MMGFAQLALLAEPSRGVDAGVVDRGAFAELIEVHQGEVLAYCCRFLGDPTLAADIAQEVFLTLWNERERYREQGKLRHYLLRIARHRCLAETKRRRSRRRLAERYAAEPRETTREPAPLEGPALARALARLAPKHRDLVILRYLGELDLADIAAITGLKTGTVKSRLSRAVAALRKELADG